MHTNGLDSHAHVGNITQVGLELNLLHKLIG